jgi:hypothetical protein
LINFKKSGQDLSEPQDFDTKGKKKKISAFLEHLYSARALLQGPYDIIFLPSSTTLYFVNGGGRSYGITMLGFAMSLLFKVYQATC